MKNFFKNASILLTISILLSITSCTREDCFTGRIVDEITGSPLEGARIHFIVKKSGQKREILDFMPKIEYANAGSAITDKNGKWEFCGEADLIEYVNFKDYEERPLYNFSDLTKEKSMEIKLHKTGILRLVLHNDPKVKGQKIYYYVYHKKLPGDYNDYQIRSDQNFIFNYTVDNEKRKDSIYIKPGIINELKINY